MLFSRRGRTDSKFTCLRKAGRLDVVHECIITSLYLSYNIRRNVVFHAILNGPPSPPCHLRIEGSIIPPIPTDQESWNFIFKTTLSGKPYKGIAVERISFEELVSSKAKKASIYVLEEGGKDVSCVEIGNNPCFILGDHIGLPKTVERFALRYGEKISLGKTPYLASSCITILNYLLDRTNTGN